MHILYFMFLFFLLSFKREMKNLEINDFVTLKKKMDLKN